MADVPESVQIGPVSYRVEHSAEAINALRVAENDAAMRAEIRYSAAVITIDPKLAISQKRLSLVHEILHGILCGLGMHVINNEDVVTPVANSLLDTLRRNPDLAAYVLSEDVEDAER
ncbi:MAG: hypothetical protein M0R06_18400 [Sphaerochaeta sp.]|jgi:hypothetical protein|nr:hypothetical protein [Sphaerochaeta sp.]